MSSNLSRLKGADKIRKRVGVMLGSDDIRGCRQTLFEILSNSIDRFKAGHGDIINVIKKSDLAYIIEDFADGLPMAWNEKENAFNWELATRILYAGGNYTTTKDTHVGQLGLNGLGLASSVLSSEYATIISVRDGKEYVVNYKKGRPVDHKTMEYVCEDSEDLFSFDLGKKILKSSANINHTGTKVSYRPDLEVFTDIDIPIEWINEKCKKQAVVNKGLTINVYDENTSTEYTHKYANGVCDYVEELGDGELISDTTIFLGEGVGKDRTDKEDYKVSYEIAFAFNNKNTIVECYHNSSELIHGGSPLEAIKSSFLSTFNNHIKNKGMYNKAESKIKWIDIEDSLLAIISSYSSITSYSNQTKTSIDNKFIQDFITDSIKEQLNVWLIENDIDATKICNQILINKRSRERSEKTRLNIRKQLGTTIDITNRIKKFVDCRTKDTTRRELYIVEGDSALGACKQSRNAEFQALMPIRGKILNCLKADYDKIFKSELIVDLLKLLGCGIEVKSKHNKDLNTFDISKLQFDKVIICTDADVDGYQIRTLILTMLYRLVPTLIEQGKVFIADTPLYEIESDGKTYFAYNDQEKAELLSTLSECKIQRSKGLGENEPEMMALTTMNPDTRKLIQITMKSAKYASDTFDMLLGDNLQGRKDYIAENFDKYLMEVE